MTQTCVHLNCRLIYLILFHLDFFKIVQIHYASKISYDTPFHFLKNITFRIICVMGPCQDQLDTAVIFHGIMMSIFAFQKNLNSFQYLYLMQFRLTGTTYVGKYFAGVTEGAKNTLVLTVPTTFFVPTVAPAKYFRTCMNTIIFTS